MQRRPWPLVLLAFLQIFGPIGSIFVSAYVNQVGFIQMGTAIWRYSRPGDLIEFYGLPLLQGVLIFNARRFGYYAILALATLSIYLNIREWRLASDVISLPILLGVTGANAALIAYLLIPNVRAIFMNPRLRWWETPPRYLVSIKAQVSTVAGHPQAATINDLSIGGGGILVASELFTPGEAVLLTFEHGISTILMRAIAVYGRADSNGSYRYGLEWQRGSADDEARLVELLRTLEEKQTAIVQTPPKWNDDFTAWWGRARKSLRAWVPEVPAKKGEGAVIATTPSPASEVPKDNV